MRILQALSSLTECGLQAARREGDSVLAPYLFDIGEDFREETCLLGTLNSGLGYSF